MNLKKTEIISRLNEMANKYQNVVSDSFSLFDYEFEINWTAHFIDRFIQRYPTYEVAEGIIVPMLDLFFTNKNELVFSGIDGFKEYKLVNIRHKNLQRQNVIVMTVERVDNVFKIIFVTVYRKTTEYINNNPTEYVLLNKKPKFFVTGEVGNRLIKFSKNNNLPESLKSISNLWK